MIPPPSYSKLSIQVSLIALHVSPSQSAGLPTQTHSDWGSSNCLIQNNHHQAPDWEFFEKNSLFSNLNFTQLLHLSLEGLWVWSLSYSVSTAVLSPNHCIMYVIQFLSYFVVSKNKSLLCIKWVLLKTAILPMILRSTFHYADSVNCCLKPYMIKEKYQSIGNIHVWCRCTGKETNWKQNMTDLCHSPTHRLQGCRAYQSL